MKESHNFKGGGLILDDPILEASEKLETPGDFTVPSYIDSRPYCLPPSDQGQTSACAGYTMAGWIEVQNWKRSNIAKQEDGLNIYNVAKLLNGSPSSEGTTLSAVVEAAKQLELIPKGKKIRILRDKEDVQFALHRFDVCMLGFSITGAWRNVNPKTGYIGDSTEITGGHAVLGCWYDKDGIGWQNSWNDWGIKGFGRMLWREFFVQFISGIVLT